MLAPQIAMLRADAKDGGDGNIGQFIAGDHRLDQLPARFSRRDLLPHVEVKYGSARVLALQLILQGERFKRIIRKAGRELRAIGVIDILLHPRLNDLRIALLVFLGKTIGSALRWSGLEVIEIPRLLLVTSDSLPHKLQYLRSKSHATRAGNIVLIVGEVSNHLVDSIHTDGGEVIVESGKITLSIGVDSSMEKLSNRLALLL